MCTKYLGEKQPKIGISEYLLGGLLCAEHFELGDIVTLALGMAPMWLRPPSCEFCEDKVDGSDPRVVSDFPGNRENVSPLQILSQSRSWLFLRQGSEKLYPGQIQVHRLLRASGLCGHFRYLKTGTLRAGMGRGEINFVSCGFVTPAPYDDRGDSCLVSLCVLGTRLRDISTLPAVGRCWQR